MINQQNRSGIPPHQTFPWGAGLGTMLRIVNNNLRSIRDFLNKRFGVIEDQFADVDRDNGITHRALKRIEGNMVPPKPKVQVITVISAARPRR